MKKTPKLRGRRRLVELGKTMSQVSLSPDERALIEEAAALERRPITQILLLGGLEYARRVTQRTHGDKHSGF